MWGSQKAQPETRTGVQVDYLGELLSLQEWVEQHREEEMIIKICMWAMGARLGSCGKQ